VSILRTAERQHKEVLSTTSAVIPQYDDVPAALYFHGRLEITIHHPEISNPFFLPHVRFIVKPS